jgi:hypothetical protein
VDGFDVGLDRAEERAADQERDRQAPPALAPVLAGGPRPQRQAARRAGQQEQQAHPQGTNGPSASVTARLRCWFLTCQSNRSKGWAAWNTNTVSTATTRSQSRS